MALSTSTAPVTSFSCSPASFANETFGLAPMPIIIASAFILVPSSNTTNSASLSPPISLTLLFDRISTPLFSKRDSARLHPSIS